MRIATTTVIGCLVGLAAARYIIADKDTFNFLPKLGTRPSSPAVVKRGEFTIQPIELESLPGSNIEVIGGDTNDGELPHHGPTLLKTSLAVDREISIFAGYVRNFASLEKWFDSKSTYTVVLAPTDHAVASLPHKPWQFPRPIESGSSSEQQDKIARDNIQSFLEHHLHMGTLPTDLSSYILETQAGGLIEVKSTRRGDTMLMANGKEIPVSRKVNVENGEIWVLDSVLV